MNKPKVRSLVVSLIVAWALSAVPAAAYIVVLKDGSQITTQKAPERQGDQVLLILQSGVRASYLVSDIDFEKTEEVNEGSNLSNVTILNTKGEEMKPEESNEEAKRPGLSDLLAARKAAQQAEAAAAAEVEPEPELEAPPIDPNLVRTQAGFVDLKALRRQQASNLELVGEINTYLTSQGSSAKVFQGSRPDWLLVEMEAGSEGSVFKAMKDAAACLAQLHQTHPDLKGLELYLQTGVQVRAGQFSLTPELANRLLTGKIDPAAFFLRYVEF